MALFLQNNEVDTLRKLTKKIELQKKNILLKFFLYNCQESAALSLSVTQHTVVALLVTSSKMESL